MSRSAADCLVPAPGFRALGPAGAPPWAAAVFEELRSANGGKLTGFLETALRFRPLDEFTIIEFGRERHNSPPALGVPGSQAPRRTLRPSRPRSSTSWPPSGQPDGSRKTSAAGKPYDISRPPRKIEIKAFSRSARGQALALEQSQVAEARRDPANYYLYVVDHVADPSQTAVRIVHGDLLTGIHDRAPPTTTYWAHSGPVNTTASPRPDPPA
jgi:hypothetical protein